MLSSGSRLGPYEILSPLGAGGMGEVYRARDTRLGREVAVKILPSTFSEDADRLRRFEGEARAASALNHPNILTIHDFGSEGAAPYVVSELLEGETLREKLASGRIPVRKALDYAAQIARGLAAAHEKGIVHRDLKPENLFVTKDGRVKILDFGLAKLTHPERSAGPLSEVPTESLGTEPGVVMGTVGYMSPEQVRGLPADSRSDLFSLGAVLYEMLTGGRAFRGDTAVETMNAILKEDPPEPSRSVADLPPSLDRIVRHCLEKSPDERFQSARDVAFALDDLSAVSSGAAAGVPRHRELRGRRFRAAALALALLATVFAASIVTRATSKSPLPSFRQLTFRRGNLGTARFTRDGQTIVFAAAWEGELLHVYTTRADSVESTALGLPPGDLLSISSSGELALSLRRALVYGSRTTGTLARVPLAGGAPRAVLEGVQDADWSPDGSNLVIVRRVEGRHRLEHPPGRILYETDGWVSYPRVSPDGKWIAFLDHPTYGDDRGGVSVVARQGGPKTVLSKDWSSERGLAWSRSGKEVWFSAATRGAVRAVYGVSLSGKLRTVLQVPGSVRIQDVSRDGRALLSLDTLRSGVLGRGVGQPFERDFSYHDFSLAADISADGKTLLICEEGGGIGPEYAIYIREMDGSPAVKLGEGLPLALSPDKKWALVQIMKSAPELVLLPTGPGERRRLERGPIEEYGAYGAFLPDGKRLIFRGTERGRKPRLYIQSVIAGPPRPISPEGVDASNLNHPISPDGLYAAVSGPDERPWLYPLNGGDPRPMPGTNSEESAVGWSLDSRSVFLEQRFVSPLTVIRLDLATGRKIPWKEFAPADPAGFLAAGAAQISPGGQAYAYTYWRLLSDLYLAEGLQ
jgi:Tol biopolymer transport system component